ncbi:GNAT family N-acetyltransferase [Chelativorans sp.]|uniref:GNAT family N-acetyltransferase n=1 Tax=Chelativorans sp. TaxID=2203393 RepID=UPI0028112241|nr:GNAT family N-acetyltransferase [Chelativorans sp.]
MAAPETTQPAGGFSATVLSADAAGLEAYAAFCAGAVYPPPQDPLWADAWLGNAGEEGVVALLSRDGAPALALALEVVRIGPLRIARFPGGQHANGNFPVLHPDALPAEGDRMDAARSLVGAIGSARPQIDMLALERQQKAFRGLPNPLLALPHTVSPNLSLAVDLTGGFDRLLKGGSGRRRRKKNRSQTRKMEAAGGYRRFAATSPREVDELLDLFFALKRARLARMGISDLFGAPHVQASFRRLFHAALGKSGCPFVLHALEVGGKVRAITGSSRTEDAIICEFSTFAEDELAHASPGDFLFFENIAEASAEGMSLYDFSVGDEPYKRLWCDVETRHADVFMGLTARGRALANASFAVTRMKRFVKQNPVMARLARRARKMSAQSES